MTRAARRVGVWFVVAAVLYAVALAVTPHALPIYDGIGFPDEPYRFVDPPAGYRHTKPPTAATATIPAAAGRNRDSRTISSTESGPQVALVVPGGAVRTPTGVSAVTVSAAPVALSGDGPPGHLWGNVYRVTFTTDAGPGRQAPGARPQIFMRAPSPQEPGPDFYVRHGTSATWSRLDTRQSGRDIYQAELAGAGDYVLAGEHPLDVNAKDPNNEAAVGVVGFVVSGLLVAAVIVLFVRAERRRSRRRATTVSGN